MRLTLPMIAASLFFGSFPALADDTGMAMQTKEGSSEPSCIRWTYTVERDPKGDPNKVRLIFTFENTCDTTAYVALAKQDGQTNVPGYPGFHEVPPKTTVGGQASTPTNLVFQTKYKYLNFWVFESSGPLSRKLGNLPVLERCNPKIEKRPNLRAKYPACRKGFSYPVG